MLVPATINAPPSTAAAQNRQLRIPHFVFFRELYRGNGRPLAPAEPVRCDRGHQQHASENTRQFGGQRRQPQAVLQYRDGKQAENRAPNGSSPAKYGRAAENDGRNRRQLIPGSRVRLSPDRDAQRKSPPPGSTSPRPADRSAPIRRCTGNPGIARSRGVKADRIQRAPDYRPVEKNAVAGKNRDKYRKLRRNKSRQVALAQEQERRIGSSE